MRLIDADALLETICKKCPELDCKPDATDTVSGCLIYDVIASAPTVDAQPVKRGHWVELPKALNPNESPCQCSNCKHVISFYYGYPKSKFCDECGAKMCGGDTDGDQV